MNIKDPTAVQAKIIPYFLNGKNVLCSAETGSGKTLAYLIPIVQNLLYSQYQKSGETIPNQPSAVILVPNRELAEQVYNVACDLCKHSDIRPHYFVGGRSTKRFINNPELKKMDILISTPGSLSKLLTNKIYNTDMVKYVIIDECDTMMDDSFMHLTSRVLRKLNVESSLHDGLELGTQIGLFSATIPKDVISTLRGLVDLESLERIQTPAVHKLMPHISQKFERVKSSEKDGLLLKRLHHNVLKSTATMVFCNTSSTSSYLSYLLAENNIAHEMVNGKMPQRVREGRYNRFQMGEVEVLIGTDILSRGLDTCRTQHVINYNFPSFLSDYIHRAGRVGRIQSQGTGFVLNYISNIWEVDLVWKIELAARKVGILDNVDANIRKQLNKINTKESSFI
ncbi:DgyrCDS10932 [Dimorphilus gyrociliatus]|nr:DgyrCDS10932 [Dimorphilus gyrociliatus]